MLQLDASQFDFKWQHLHIKPLCEADLQLYIDLYTCDRVMRFIHSPLSVEKAIASFKRVIELNQNLLSKRLFLSVTTELESKPVAICCIANLDRKNMVAEIGNMVLPKAHGKKIAHTATIALLNQIQNKLGINNFLMDIHPENIPAVRAARILGFRACSSNPRLYRYESVVNQSI